MPKEGKLSNCNRFGAIGLNRLQLVILTNLVGNAIIVKATEKPEVKPVDLTYEYDQHLAAKVVVVKSMDVDPGEIIRLANEVGASTPGFGGFTFTGRPLCVRPQVYYLKLPGDKEPRLMQGWKIFELFRQ